jgi:hypothetical protein
MRRIRTRCGWIQSRSHLPHESCQKDQIWELTGRFVEAPYIAKRALAKGRGALVERGENGHPEYKAGPLGIIVKRSS